MKTENDQQARAKAYQKKKQVLTLFNLAVTPAILALIILTPLSVQFKTWAASLTTFPYAVTAFYFLFLSIFTMLLDLPLDFYSSHILEHQFQLSNRNLVSWIADFIKRSLLSFVLALAMIEGLYALIWNFPSFWWVLAWGAYAGVSYVLGKLFPVLIVPLFYKYSPVTNDFLRERIFKMAKTYGMPVENIYSLNLSRTTKKANAAFMGIGKTKRVVLSDTLLEHFTPEEIESVVAHELGHYKHHDIWKHLGFGLVTSFILFWLAFKIAGPLAERAGFEGGGDVAAMPVLFLVFYLFSLVLTPLQSALGRRMERAADKFSLNAFSYPDVFISAMQKLAQQNLADPSPHPVYEWFFYDHPAIPKRIRMAEEWRQK
jgi:STE24 endopeptidase